MRTLPDAVDQRSSLVACTITAIARRACWVRLARILTPGALTSASNGGEPAPVSGAGAGSPPGEGPGAVGMSGSVVSGAVTVCSPVVGPGVMTEDSDQKMGSIRRVRGCV